MRFKRSIKPLMLTSALALMALPSLATVVEFQTSQGNIEVNLFDNATPKTVENFLNYVNAGSYDTTVIHRSVFQKNGKGFVVQGGGFTFDGSKLVKSPANPAVVNEPIYSNVKGTIAMAKLGSNVNSATNQWFFNMENNAGNLDVQNGGFTVFGQVISGFDILEKIQKLTHCGDIPFDHYDKTQCSDGSSAPGFENFVSITNIDIKDASIDTAANLTPIKSSREVPADNTSSGGAIGLISLLTAITLFLRRRVLK